MPLTRRLLIWDYKCQKCPFEGKFFWVLGPEELKGKVLDVNCPMCQTRIIICQRPTKGGALAP